MCGFHLWRACGLILKYRPKCIHIFPTMATQVETPLEDLKDSTVATTNAEDGVLISENGQGGETSAAKKKKKRKKKAKCKTKRVSC